MNDKIEELRISIDSSLTEGLKKMDEVGKKLLLVFEGDRFVAVLSIGDIQRAIIQNRELSQKVGNVLRKDFKYCSEKESLEQIKSKMFALRTECMPVLNEKGELVELYSWDEMFEVENVSQGKILTTPVVVMAGGKGTRLKPITNIIPKPLIPLGDTPMIEVIVDSFNKLGVDQFYFTVNYKAEMIKNYFEEKEGLPYQIDYVYEEKPLGTAGSLHMLKGKINQTFFLTNCDILIKEDYSEILKYHHENQNELTLVGAFRHYRIPYGVMETKEGGILDKIIEKPEYDYLVNAGLYIIEPHLLNEIPENEMFHITHLMEIIQKRNGRVGVFPVSEKSWLDIGEWKEYKTSWEQQGNNKFFI